MSTVTFKSVPENAKVAVTFVDTFIKTCFSGSNVICDKDTLHQYLLDKTVSNKWWDLTDAQRKTLGIKILRDFAPIPYARGFGDPDCVGTNISWKYSLWCGECATIVVIKLDHCMYRRDYNSQWYYALSFIPPDKWGDIHCNAEEGFYLPCSHVSNRDPEVRHGFNALQIGCDRRDFDSYLFFDCHDLRLSLGFGVGNWRLERGASIKISRMGGRDIVCDIPSSGKPICSEG